MAVYHSQVIVVILLAHKAPRILAEGPDFIFKWFWVSDELGLIEHIVDPLHDFIPHLHPDADIHCSRFMGDLMLCAKPFQPIRSSAPSGNHHILSKNLLALPGPPRLK